MQRLQAPAGPVDEAALAQLLALPSGAVTGLALRLDAGPLPLERIDEAGVPGAFGFLREPQPPAA